MKSIPAIVLISALLFSGTSALANTPLRSDTASSLVGPFRSYADVVPQGIRVPTVVEVPLGDGFLERLDFAVEDRTADEFQPYYFIRETFTNSSPVTITSDARTGSEGAMIDEDNRTYAEFPVSGEQESRVRMTLKADRLITASSFTFSVDDNIALPRTVEVRAVVGGRETVLLAERSLGGQAVTFPRATADTWYISFRFGQPLRIAELRLIQENATRSTRQAIRFLAQPSHTYRVYFDSDRASRISVGESPNLASRQDVVTVAGGPVILNPLYTVADTDADGIPDKKDNCVSVANTDQVDINANGRGDMCEDFDRDGVGNSLDNCPDIPNRSQADVDGDKIGDECDTEESRITEKYPWLPWAGIGFAGFVLVVLFALTLRHSPQNN